MIRFGGPLLAVALLCGMGPTAPGAPSGGTAGAAPGTVTRPGNWPCPAELEGREWCVGCRGLHSTAIMHCTGGHFGYTRLCHRPEPGDLCFGPDRPTASSPSLLRPP